MKAFKIVPSIAEYMDFRTLAKELKLGARDLILTNEYIYNPTIAALNLGCHTCFQEKFGGGEPTDVMVDAILDDLRGKEFDRIIAVGGGTVIDIAKVLTVAKATDRVDDLYDRMANLEKEHELIIVPTTCGTGSEVTNISIINRTTKGVKVGLVSPAMFADEAALVPGMLLSLPYPVFATSSIDAMVHAVESYLSPNACALSELFSAKALHLILSCWKDAVAAGGKDAWKKHALEFLRASNYAGIAFGHAGCAAVHAMAYPLGGVHHIPHGQANQLMFADVMRKYQEKKPIGKLNQLEELLGAMTDFFDELAALSDDELRERIRSIAAEHGMTLNDAQTQQLADLFRKIQSIGGSNFAERVQDLPETVEKIRESGESALSTAGTVWDSIRGFFRSVAKTLSAIFGE